LLKHDGGKAGFVAGGDVAVAEVVADFVVDNHLAVAEEGFADAIVAIRGKAPANVVDEDKGADAAAEFGGANGGAGGFDGGGGGEDEVELTAIGDFPEGEVGAGPAAGVVEGFMDNAAELGEIALYGAARGNVVSDSAFGWSGGGLDNWRGLGDSVSGSLGRKIGVSDG